MERGVEERLELELRRELQKKDDDLQRKLQKKDDDLQRQFEDQWAANEERWWTWHQEEVARELLEYQQNNDLTEQQKQDLRQADENRILDSKGLMVLESPTAKA